MRVISGTAKGHKLKCIKGSNTRPTQDRIKESIFNIIMQYIKDSLVLDLFSGTGSLGIEALSRGAKFSIMVDNNPLCVKVINENLDHTKLSDKAKVICGDCISLIRRINESFDIIFMDAPYNRGLVIPALEQIGKHNMLNPNGITIVERDIEDEIQDNIYFEVFREEFYGHTAVSFLRKLKTPKEMIL